MRNEGFSLLEVIVATAILGIALLAIIQAFSQGLQGLSIDKEYEDAISRAVLVTETLFLNLPEEGLRKPGDAYRWRWKIESIWKPETNDENVRLKKDKRSEKALTPFSCEVVWDSASKQRSLQIKTLGFFPNP